MSGRFAKPLACLALLMGALAGAPEARAQSPAPEVARAALGAARAGAAEAARLAAGGGFDDHVRHQAALELQLGLALYRARDDYRAVGALRRWRLLDGTPRSAYLSGLLIGHVYQRNGQHPDAALSYEAAVLAAPTPTSRAWSYLLSTQQVCVPMGVWAACGQRLAELSGLEALSPRQRDLVTYQRTLAALMLGVEPPSYDPSALADPALAAHARALLALPADPSRRGLDLRHPALAAGLSAVLPGAGQAYNGRWTDAAIALGFNAAFAGATYYAFAELESIPLGVASATLLAGFYFGNIANAYVDAEAHNARAYDDHYAALLREHWARVRFSVTDDAVSFGYAFGWPGDATPSEQAPTPPSRDEHF
jgi:hypothetical protein